MARHCMRPGCDRPAAARLSYDTQAAAVWLDQPLDDGQPAQQVCSVHAESLTAPLGWSVTDRRLIGVGRPGATRSTPVSEPTGEEPVDEPARPEEAVDSVSEDRVAVAPAASTREPSKSTDKSRGKLLERAFEWTGPQHSVLTTGRDHRPRRRD